ncbi:MAG: glycoside hydrolase domain-containing protein, partial [Rhizomicrobium sp.]
MVGIAATAHACYGFDTDTKLTAASAKALRASIYNGNPIEFAVRYVSIEGESGSDITAEEVDIILSANLALLLVQHVRNPNWSPSAAQGTKDGIQAAKNAATVGYAKGCHLVVDLEGILPGTAASVVIAYINSWASAIIAAGYRAMVYVGYNTMLTPTQLYENLPNVHAYWS